MENNTMNEMTTTEAIQELTDMLPVFTIIHERLSVEASDNVITCTSSGMESLTEEALQRWRSRKVKADQAQACIKRIKHLLGYLRKPELINEEWEFPLIEPS